VLFRHKMYGELRHDDCVDNGGTLDEAFEALAPSAWSGECWVAYRRPLRFRRPPLEEVTWRQERAAFAAQWRGPTQPGARRGGGCSSWVRRLAHFRFTCHGAAPVCLHVSAVRHRTTPSAPEKAESRCTPTRPHNESCRGIGAPRRSRRLAAFLLGRLVVQSIAA
jgi:hypothetical protein